MRGIIQQLGKGEESHKGINRHLKMGSLLFKNGKFFPVSNLCS